LASNAEKLLQRLEGTSGEARQLPTDQPNWDVPALFEKDALKKPLDAVGISQSEQVAPKLELAREKFAPQMDQSAGPNSSDYTYGSPFGNTRTETYKSPFGYKFQSTEQTTDYYSSPYKFPAFSSNDDYVAKPVTPTTMQILNKPLTEMTAKDLGVIANNTLDQTNDFLSTVNGDHAGMAALLVRFKTEYLASKFAGNSAMVYGLSAIPLTALSGYALKHDVEGFSNSASTAGKAYYGAASALDTAALGGSALMLVPQVRNAAKTTAALSITARAVAGWTHNAFFKD
jgi:hypothetical protein